MSNLLDFTLRKQSLTLWPVHKTQAMQKGLFKCLLECLKNAKLLIQSKNIQLICSNLKFQNSVFLNKLMDLQFALANEPQF